MTIAKRNEIRNFAHATGLNEKLLQTGALLYGLSRCFVTLPPTYTTMYIIDLHYIVPLEQLDAHMTEHVTFLNKYYKLNIFVASGRKVPRTGGIILALAASREEVEEIIKEDPFYFHQLAEFKITEFMTSQCHPEFKKILKTR